MLKKEEVIKTLIWLKSQERKKSYERNIIWKLRDTKGFEFWLFCNNSMTFGKT